MNTLISSWLDQLILGLMRDKARVCVSLCKPWLLSSCLWAAKTRALSSFLLVQDEPSWIFCCTAKYLLFWKSPWVCFSWPWGAVLLCSQWIQQDSLSSMCKWEWPIDRINYPFEPKMWKIHWCFLNVVFKGKLLIIISVVFISCHGIMMIWHLYNLFLSVLCI